MLLKNGGDCAERDVTGESSREQTWKSVKIGRSGRGGGGGGR